MKRISRNAPSTTRNTKRRAAFTLVELLTVIAIIGMLSAISISTVRVAIETARTSQTETTISRIDSSLTAIYEKYQYRRIEALDANPEARARERVRKLRDLLRRDLPCSPEELAANSPSGETSPLQEAYRYSATNVDGSTKFLEDEPESGLDTDRWRTANAELLYLIVTNADPESRSMFSDREVADTNGNGLYEFIDGWGRPICWLRWAPGLESSDRQPTADLAAIGFAPDGSGLDRKYDADPFNPLQLDFTDSGQTTPGWFLVPYIFSAGPDGEYGLIPSPSGSVAVAEMNDPFSTSLNVGLQNALGAPDGTETHKDNINNHTLIR